MEGDTLWKSSHTAVKEVVDFMLAVDMKKDAEVIEDLEQSVHPGAKECMDRFLPLMMYVDDEVDAAYEQKCVADKDLEEFDDTKPKSMLDKEEARLVAKELEKHLRADVKDQYMSQLLSAAQNPHTQSTGIRDMSLHDFVQELEVMLAQLDEKGKCMSRVIGISTSGDDLIGCSLAGEQFFRMPLADMSANPTAGDLQRVIKANPLWNDSYAIIVFNGAEKLAAEDTLPDLPFLIVKVLSGLRIEDERELASEHWNRKHAALEGMRDVMRIVLQSYETWVRTGQRTLEVLTRACVDNEVKCKDRYSTGILPAQ